MSKDADDTQELPLSPARTSKATPAVPMVAHEPTEPMLQFFIWQDTRDPGEREIRREFGLIAQWLVVNLPRNAERTVTLRKLRDTMDCALWARIAK